ncbi:MAG: DUF4198 domain-containing protein [Candidatus Hydrogenedentota bacterium]
MLLLDIILISLELQNFSEEVKSMCKIKIIGVALITLIIISGTSSMVLPHFQLVYTPESNVEGTSVPFKLIFTHPFEAGHTMDIGKDEAGNIKGMKELFLIHKGERTDLVDKLKEITFTSLTNSGRAYDLTLDNKCGYKGGGDFVLIAVPYPYYEAAEDIYIQQVTKVMINRSGIATDWSERCAEGYPEIMPLVMPYDVWVGGIFRGVVIDGKGNPVANAEIEVEYINYEIDMKANKFTGKPKISTEGHGTAVILANKDGEFSFVPTKAGYWGFAALGAGGKKEYEGKELSEDAVLWIEAVKTE